MIIDLALGPAIYIYNYELYVKSFGFIIVSYDFSHTDSVIYHTGSSDRQ